MNNEKEIRSYLLDFGLTEKEITVYLTSLKNGASTIMNLSRLTGIKRSTTHNIVEQLIKKGLMSQTYGETRRVVAEDPARLEFLLKLKQYELKKLSNSLDDIVKEIRESTLKS